MTYLRKSLKWLTIVLFSLSFVAQSQSTLDAVKERSTLRLGAASSDP